MTKPRHPRRKAEKYYWTDAEVATLRERYPTTLTTTLSREMGIPINAIHSCAAKHGIKKTHEYKAEQARQASHGIGSRFQPGTTPWNKGLKGWKAGGRSAETRFKKGMPARNHRPVGSTRVTVDGYIEIKIAEPRTWAQLHREVWKQHHGSYPPPDQAVTFRDGDKSNCDIGNLELISRAKLMLRNSVHNYGAEIAQVIQLRGAIARQINKHARRAA